ncbi:MAG: hypothetical protein Q9205_002819 [Flavoplaca limonia]
MSKSGRTTTFKPQLPKQCHNPFATLKQLSKKIPIHAKLSPDSIPFANTISNAEPVAMELWEPHSSAPLNGHARDGGNHRSSSSASFASSQASRITRRNPLEKLAGKTKQLTKRLLDPMLQQEEHQVLSRLSDPVLRVLKEDPAFNPTKLDSKPQSGRSLAVKIQSNLQTSAAAVLHPKEGAKGKATRSTAGRLSKVERPYISKEMDHEFLEAHDKLSQAQSMATSDQLTPGPSEGDYEEKIEELKAQRESLRAAHTLSRHVQRVRVVPKRHIALPNKDDFVELDKEGRYIGYHWPNWIGRCLLYYTQDFSAQYIDDFDELPFTQFDVERSMARYAAPRGNRLSLATILQTLFLRGLPSPQSPSTLAMLASRALATSINASAEFSAGRGQDLLLSL